MSDGRSLMSENWLAETLASFFCLGWRKCGIRRQVPNTRMNLLKKRAKVKSIFI